MRTSNKILIGLLLIVFTVPFLLASALSKKIERKEFTVEKNSNNKKPENVRSGAVQAYKVVKVIAPRPYLLNCRVNISNKMSFSYYKPDGNDSVKIYTANDTLYVSYLAASGSTSKNEREDHNNITVDVNLPACTNLIVDGATVMIESKGNSLDNISVTLKNRGEVIDAGSDDEDEDTSKVDKARSNTKPVDQANTTNKNKVQKLARKSAAPLVNVGWEGLNLQELLIYDVFYRI